MKKLMWATHKSLFGQIATGACLVGGSAGLIFGVSAGTFKVSYFNLNDGAARVSAYNSNNYVSQNIASQWNMYETLDKNGNVAVKGVVQPDSADVTQNWWETVHGFGAVRLSQARLGIDPTQMGDLVYETRGERTITDEQKAQRMKYSTLVIDGSTHSALDRSFNQGLYNGIANFTQNYDHDVNAEGEATILKPAQDNTQEFINIYRAAAEKTRILCLAGFNHVTPINALGTRLSDGTIKFADPNIQQTGLMLMDGDITNNQNVASVLFRSDQPAFLTAIATCMYFYNNVEMYHEGFKDLVVGAYGGTAIPTVTIYMGGFQRGIEFFNEFVLKNSILGIGAYNYITGSPEEPTESEKFFVDKLLPASKYEKEIAEIMTEPTTEKVADILNKLYDEFSVKMIKLGGFSTHFSGSFAAGDAIGISKQLLNRGASAIIAVAGPQSLDTAQEIMNQNKNCIVIGVDSAMERSDYQKPFTNKAFEDKSEAPDQTKSAQAGNIIKFSAVKDMTCVSNKMLRLAAQGKHWDVDSDKPWTTRVQVPSCPKDEIINESSGLTIEPDTAAGTFDVKGMQIPSGKDRYTIEIPTSIVTEGGQKLLLNKVSGFTQSLLANVDTIKIKGSVAEGQMIYLVGGGFDFSDQDQYKKIKYIDFSDVPPDKITTSGTGYVFKNLHFTDSEKQNKGFIKLGASTEVSSAKSLYEKLADSTELSSFIHKEADPYKSICSFGFKTCGNIENGLISISWDGWAPLVQALSFVDFYQTKLSDAETFAEVWTKIATEYCAEHTELPGTYTSVIKDPTQLITYDSKSPINEFYSHTMSILGRLFNTYYVRFSKDMTIEIVDGKAQKPSTDENWMTILDWLKYNMYFVA